jgi:type VI secretion system secreted protein VgrG
MRFEDSIPSGRVTSEPNGGKARFGINSAAHPEMRPGFWTDPAEIAIKDAEEVEFNGYWRHLQLGGILNQAVANKVFDMAINMGTKPAAVLAQRACVMGKYGLQLNVDGIIGQATLDAINSCPPDVMLQGLRDLSIAYYQHIEQVHPAEAKWEGSWMARAKA